MPHIDARSGEVVIRIVYDGAPEAGKTTNIIQLGRQISLHRRGATSSPGTIGERTEFFDWLDFSGGFLDGRRVRCQLVSVPGQSSLLHRRRYLLEKADVVVFVADSRTPAAVAENFAMMRRILGRVAGDVPICVVVQANKQDLPDARPIAEVARDLDAATTPVVAGAAARGEGVMETFILAVRLASDRVRRIDLEALAGGTRHAETPEELHGSLVGIESRRRRSNTETRIVDDPDRTEELPFVVGVPRPSADEARLARVEVALGAAERSLAEALTAERGAAERLAYEVATFRDGTGDAARRKAAHMEDLLVHERERSDAERLVRSLRAEAEHVRAVVTKLAAERRNAERAEAERLEAERIEAERIASVRLAAQQLDPMRLEMERLARIQAARLQPVRIEAERLDAARAEATRREAARQEAARQEAARLEAARLEAARQEAARQEAEHRLEAERLAAARHEAARLERLEAERLERLEAERLEAARLGAERLEAARLEAERLEAERLEAARLEAERLERLEAERLEAARLEAERLEAARLEAERLERLEAERLEAARLEAERLEAARLEAERLEAERLEAARLEAERLEAARLEAERLEAERLEAARLEAERLEAARLEAERLEAERLEAARLEAERLEAERLNMARLEAARVEAERVEVERVEAGRQATSVAAARRPNQLRSADAIVLPDAARIAYGHVWPPVKGRAAVAVACAGEVHIPSHVRAWAPPGACELTTQAGWTLHASDSWVYPTEASAREGLLAMVRAQLARIVAIVEGRTLAVARAEDGWRTWMLTPPLTSVGEEARAAIESHDVDRLDRCVRETCHVLRRMPATALVELTLDDVAIVDGHAVALAFTPPPATHDSWRAELRDLLETGARHDAAVASWLESTGRTLLHAGVDP